MKNPLRFCFLLAFTLLSSVHCNGTSPGGTGAAPIMAPQFKPVDVTVVQREGALIPGLTPAAKIQLRDITEGQVLLSIKDEKANDVLAERSVRAGDALNFSLGGQTYYLEVLKLDNVAIGDDFGVFRVTTTPPPLVKSGEGGGTVVK